MGLFGRRETPEQVAQREASWLAILQSQRPVRSPGLAIVSTFGATETLSAASRSGALCCDPEGSPLPSPEEQERGRLTTSSDGSSSWVLVSGLLEGEGEEGPVELARGTTRVLLTSQGMRGAMYSGETPLVRTFRDYGQALLWRLDYDHIDLVRVGRSGFIVVSFDSFVTIVGNLIWPAKSDWQIDTSRGSEERAALALLNPWLENQADGTSGSDRSERAQRYLADGVRFAKSGIDYWLVEPRDI